MGASDPVEEKEKPIKPLDAQDIAFLKHYGQGPYSSSIRKAEEASDQMGEHMHRINMPLKRRGQLRSGLITSCNSLHSSQTGD